MRILYEYGLNKQPLLTIGASLEQYRGTTLNLRGAFMPVITSESNECPDKKYGRTVVKGTNEKNFEVCYRGSRGKLFYLNAIWTIFETINKKQTSKKNLETP